MLARLLSWLSGLLTLLTAAAVLALVGFASSPTAGGPAANEPAPPPGPADETVPSTAPSVDDPERPATNDDRSWLRLPERLMLTGARIALARTSLGDVEGLTIDRLVVEPGAHGMAVRGDVTLADPAAVLAALGLEDVEWEGASVDVAAMAAGATSGLRLRVTTRGPGSIRHPAMPEAFPYESIDATLSLSDDRQTVTIHDLELVSPVATLVATGSVSMTALGPAILAQASMDGLDVTWAPRLWPEGVALGARDWLLPNLTAGEIDALAIALDIDPIRDADGVLAPNAVRGEATVSGVEVHYLRPMRPVTNARATFTFDAQRFDFAIDGGQVGDVIVESARLAIADYLSDDVKPWMNLDLDATGPVATILRVTDEEPLRLATRKGLLLDGVEGAGNFDLVISLPMLRDLSFDDVELAFGATFDGVRLPGVIAGRDLDSSDFEVRAGPTWFEARGRGTIVGVPLNLAFVSDAANDSEILTATGRVNADDLDDLGVPSVLGLAGTVAIDASADVRDKDRPNLDVVVDITTAEVLFEPLSLWKPEGIQGELRATVIQEPAGVTIESATASWAGVELAAEGSVDAAGRLERLLVDPIVIGGSSARLAIVREGELLDVQLTGSRLEFDPQQLFRQQDRDTRPAAPADATATEDLRATIDLGEVVTGNGLGFAQVTGLVERVDGIIQRADLRGATLASAAPFTLTIEPRTAGHQLVLTSDDAGDVLQGLGLSQALHGGRLRIDGLITRQRPDLLAEGSLELDDFVIRKGPTAIKVLSLTPPIEGLDPDAIQIDRFTGTFGIDGDTLRIGDVLMVGSNIAVRANGTFDLASDRIDLQGNLAPLATVNRFLGRVPLIGALLQGSSGAGAFAVTFTVVGDPANPEVTVNPFSLLAPGVLRDLFGGTPMPETN